MDKDIEQGLCVIIHLLPLDDDPGAAQRQIFIRCEHKVNNVYDIRFHHKCQLR